MRNQRFDPAAHRFQRVRQLACAQAGFCSHHPAPQIDADRGRNHRPNRRYHAADRRAFSQMHVRHHSDPFVDERHRGDIP